MIPNEEIMLYRAFVRYGFCRWMVRPVSRLPVFEKARKDPGKDFANQKLLAFQEHAIGPGALILNKSDAKGSFAVCYLVCIPAGTDCAICE